jgi:CheY-like chemotaxis protein
MRDSTQILDTQRTLEKDFVETSENQIRVLLVDDDATVRNFLCAVLLRAGYEVLTASNGQEAWTRFEQSLPRIGVLVSDVQMPAMSGVDLARLAARACPSLPILLISGNSFPSDELPVRCGFLQKPFHPSAFLKSVQETVKQGKSKAVRIPARSARRA